MEARYRLLFENSYDAILMTSPDGRILDANPAACTLLGRTVDQLVKAGRKGVVDRGDPRLAVALDERAGRGAWCAEFTMIHADGTKIPVEASSVIFRDEKGRRRTCMIVRDLTGRRRAEEALRCSEARYRGVVEAQTEIISRILADGTFTFANEEYCRFFGRSADQLIGTRWQPVAVAEDLPVIEEGLRSLSRANPVVVIENRVCAGDGQVRWMQFVNHGRFDAQGHLVETLSVGRDVTGRREAENASIAHFAKLRTLAARIEGSVERERRRIAEGLHDHVGQVLALAGMRLGMLKIAPGDREALAVRREVRTCIDEAISFTRSLSAELHPPLLRQLGLAPTLRWLASEIERREGIRVTFRAGSPVPHPGEATGAFLFRAAQELSRNAIQHGRARRIDLSLRGGASSVRLRVRDDGVGFDVEPGTSAAPSRGFGLFSLAERAEEMGGRLEIRSAPGQGTLAVLVVPLEGRQE